MIVNKLLIFIVLAGGLIQALSVQAQTGTPAAVFPEFTKVRLETFDKVWNTINEKHYDPTFGGVNWLKVREKYLPKAQAARSDEEFHNVLREMLGELKLSHFNIFPPPPTVGSEDSTGYVGLKIIWLGGRPIVETVEKNSSAERAGIKPGFVIISAGGRILAELLRPLRESLEKRTMGDGIRRVYIERSVEAILSGRAGTSVPVELTDDKGKTFKADLLRNKFEGEMSQPVGSFPKQQVIFESRLLPENIGYIKFNMWTIPQLAKIRTAIREFSKADGIIFDLRGNPGGIGGLAAGTAGLISDKQFSLGSMNSRSGVMNLVGYPQKEPYLGKVVVIIDHGSASTSEMFAAGIQESGRGKLVGEQSAGAILLSVFDPLPTGYIFQYAISDYRSPKNVLIEGLGVKPDVEAIPTGRSLLEGKDVQLDAAIRTIKDQ